MRKFYFHVAAKLRYFPWGRALVDHISYHYRFYENFEALYTALILALIIKSFIIEAYKIPSESMLDTLQINDRIFVSKFTYQLHDVEVGDIIVFKTENIEGLDYDSKPYYIKRVVGLPGDHLEVRNHNIFRNGELVDDPPFFVENEYYKLRRNSPNRFDVPNDKVFVFGDNSGNSWDSRAWGGVPVENIMGKAVFRYWPITRMGFINDVPPPSVRRNIANKKPSSSFSPSNAQAAESR
jgi:signal peptidase I